MLSLPTYTQQLAACTEHVPEIMTGDATGAKHHSHVPSHSSEVIDIDSLPSPKPTKH